MPLRTAFHRLLFPLAWAMLPLSLLLLPPVVPPESYHQFADQRTLLGIPHAMDVLSNMAFAAVALWGLVVLRSIREAALPPEQRELCAVFFCGLLLTTLCSGWYHLAPDGARLALDRAGMALAFAGLLGLASALHWQAGSGLRMALATVFASAVGIACSLYTGNVLPWSGVQAAGLAFLLWSTMRRQRWGMMQVQWLAVVLAYGVAKMLEFADSAAWTLSAGWIAGHTLKHVVAAGAAVPVVLALRRLGQNA
jgi:hypothetical protein